MTYADNAIPSVAYVIQDGEMFYIFNDTAGENMVAFREAPEPVEFLDHDAAKRARDWLCAYAPHSAITFIE